MHIGTAGWSIPRGVAASFAGDGAHLDRYAKVLSVAEINSSFHRPHRPQTYERWARQTPANFRFALKLPRSVTHDGRLREVREPLQRFLDESAGLGQKRAVLLVQLPPSLVFEPGLVGDFFALLRERHAGAVVCEPRHASWFEPAADSVLIAHRIGRVGADPARLPAAAQPGGWLGPHGDGRDAVVYHRWHGSPRMYWSSYEPAWLARQVAALREWPKGADRWCIFDNTTSGAALENALALAALMAC